MPDCNTCRTRSKRPTVLEGLQFDVSSLLNYTTCSWSYLCPIIRSCLTWSEPVTRPVPLASSNSGFLKKTLVGVREVGQKQKLSLSKSDRRTELHGGFMLFPHIFPLSTSVLLRLCALPSRSPSRRPHTTPRAKSRRPAALT